MPLGRICHANCGLMTVMEFSVFTSHNWIPRIEHFLFVVVDCLINKPLHRRDLHTLCGAYNLVSCNHQYGRPIQPSIRRNKLRQCGLFISRRAHQPPPGDRLLELMIVRLPGRNRLTILPFSVGVITK